MISVSIVSHGHGKMVERLLAGLLQHCPEVTEILITKNVPETLSLRSDKIKIIDNKISKGFSANHNAAFRLSRQRYFCPLNPDIAILHNPFPALLSTMEQTGANLIAPLILAPSGRIEDSIRRFPTIRSLIQKALGGADGRYSVEPGHAAVFPDWVAGMFMLFERTAYEHLNGFDERFFLYYEDVDICARAWKRGLSVAACPGISVIHHAQRASHRNMLHLRMHLTSMARYFLKHGLCFHRSSCNWPQITYQSASAETRADK